MSKGLVQKHSRRSGTEFALRSDLAIPIEQNHRNNGMNSRIFRLMNGQRWPEDAMRKWEVLFERTLNHDILF